MKTWFLALLFLFEQANACELVAPSDIRSDIQDAFVTKSFLNAEKKYLSSDDLAIEVFNEYDDERPSQRYRQKNIKDLGQWFFNQYQHHDALIVLNELSCSEGICQYEIPERTLHHGVYLTGFSYTNSNECTVIKKISIYLG